MWPARPALAGGFFATEPLLYEEIVSVLLIILQQIKLSQT